MRALVYLRISLDRTGDELGVTRQREDCLERCASRGWQMVAIESDNDLSASTGKRRPGFEALLQAVESGSVDVVVAWSLDRLQRNRRDEARLYESCINHGVMISLVKGADLDFKTAAGRLIADTLGSVARMEVEQKGERQRRAQLQLAQAGKPGSGRRPFGFEDDKVTVRPDEAEAIRRAYESVLAGVSLSEIARDWNRAGFVTGQKNRDGGPSPWRRDSVRVVLSNRRNIGQRVYRGEVTSKAIWPAIVDSTTFDAVIGILNDPSRSSGPTSARNLLSGLARCQCGAHVHAGGGRGRGTVTYRCAGSHGHVARRAEPVDDYVGKVVAARLSLPDARELLIDRNVPDLAELHTEAVALRARMDAAAAAFADGVIDAGQLRIINDRCRAKLAAVEAKQVDGARLKVLGPLVDTADVAAAWDALTTSRKRAVIDLLMDVVVLPPGRGVRTFDPATVVCTPKSA